MNVILEFLRMAGIFVAGLGIRLLALLAVLALFSVPVVAGYGVYLLVRKMRERRLGFVNLGGLLLADARHYSPGHTWLRQGAKGRVRVGIDDLARCVLHRATMVILPRRGTTLAAGLPAVTVACGGRTTTIPAPVSGTVTAVNEAVTKNPGLLETSPYGRGWLFAMKPATASYLMLPTGPDARAWFRDEEARFSHFVEGELGLAAADGGELIEPVPALLTEEKWRAMASAFLGATH